MSPMLINKFGPLGTDLGRMTLKIRLREPVYILRIQNGRQFETW